MVFNSGARLSIHGIVRKPRVPKRRKSPRNRGTKRKVAARQRALKVEREILDLVRTGVEQFILKNSTVEDFLRIIRDVSEKEKIYSHQLTRSVFSKLVKEAIKKRDLTRSR
jgi:hypothetical protein